MWVSLWINWDWRCGTVEKHPWFNHLYQKHTFLLVCHNYLNSLPIVSYLYICKHLLINFIPQCLTFPSSPSPWVYIILLNFYFGEIPYIYFFSISVFILAFIYERKHLTFVSDSGLIPLACSPVSFISHKWYNFILL